MKQIVDKLNKIARAVDSNVTLPSRKLIIDSLDAITTAFKGTIVNSNLIVDKLDAIAWAIGQYDGGGGQVELEKRNVQITLRNGYSSDSTTIQYLLLTYPTIVWDDNGTWYGSDFCYAEVAPNTPTTITLGVAIHTGYKYTLIGITPMNIPMRIVKISGNADLMPFESPADGVVYDRIVIPPTLLESSDLITIEIELIPIFR